MKQGRASPAMRVEGYGKLNSLGAKVNGMPREVEKVKGFEMVASGGWTTMVAMSMVSQEIVIEKESFFPVKPVDYDKFIIISIGTGSVQEVTKYSARATASWGKLRWVVNGNSTPIVDTFSQASSDMVDIQASILFQALKCEDSYLRIQEDSLIGDEASVDVATKKNLDRLLQIGKNLLKKRLSRVNLDTGLFVPVDREQTNEDALVHFAEILSVERRHRLLHGHSRDRLLN